MKQSSVCQALFLLPFLLLLGACGQRVHYDSRLLAIEEEAGKAPLNTLQQLERWQGVGASPADSMLYALLYTETLRAMGLSQRNEAYIKPCVSFFKDCHDRRRQARSSLAYALCLCDNAALAEATTVLKQTETLAGLLDDNAMVCQLYMALADVNAQAGHEQLMMDCLRKAYAAAHRAANRPMEMQCLYQMGLVHYRQKQADGLLSVVRLSASLGQTADSLTAVRRATTKGLYWLLRRDTVRAYPYLSQGCQNDIDGTATLLCGNILASRGSEMAAEARWYEATTYPNVHVRKEALKQLLKRANREADTHRRAFLLQQLNDCYEHDIPATVRARIIDIQRQSDARRETERSSGTVWWLTLAIVALGGAMATVAIAYCRHVRRKQQLQTNGHAETELLSDDTVLRLHRQAKQGHPATDSDLAQLLPLVNTHDSHLSELLAHHRGLSMAEVNVTLLTRLRFLPSETAVLLSVSPQSVSNMRVRLLQKLFGEKGGARLFDERIRHL